jgi:TRAP-type C4-dicarboxylate transport system permease small subunit
MKKDFFDFLNDAGDSGLGVFGVAITVLCCLFLFIVGGVFVLKLIAPWWRALTDAQQGQLFLSLLILPPLIFLVKFLRFRKARRVERVVERMGV